MNTSSHQPQVSSLYSPSLVQTNDGSFEKSNVQEKKVKEHLEGEEEKIEKVGTFEGMDNEAFDQVLLRAAIGCLNVQSKEHRPRSRKQRRCIFNIPEVARQRLDKLQLSDSRDMEELLSSIFDNPWSRALHRKPNPIDLRMQKLAAKFYDSCGIGGRKVKCCVTGTWGNLDQVIVGHIVPKKSSNLVRHDYEPGQSRKLPDVRNLLVMSKSIMEAFHKQRICFLCVEDEPGTFKIKIWDQKVCKEPIFPGSKVTIGSLEGKFFSFHYNRMPYTRFLSWHAQCSYKVAIVEGWIQRETKAPEEYGSPLKNDVILFSSLKSDSEDKESSGYYLE